MLSLACIIIFSGSGASPAPRRITTAGTQAELQAGLVSGVEVTLLNDVQLSVGVPGGDLSGLFVSGVSDLVLRGDGFKVDGVHERRCLEVESSNMRIEDLTIINGWTSGYGGGIKAGSSTLTLLRCVMMSCLAHIGGGGLAQLSGSLVMNDCTVKNNVAEEGGGGVGIGGGVVEMHRVAVAKNHAVVAGGGFYVGMTGATVRLTECNITANSIETGSGGRFAPLRSHIVLATIHLSVVDVSACHCPFVRC
jgi:hypothetical protein